MHTNPLTESDGFSFTILENAWLIEMFSHAHFATLSFRNNGIPQMALRPPTRGNSNHFTSYSNQLVRIGFYFLNGKKNMKFCFISEFTDPVCRSQLTEMEYSIHKCHVCISVSPDITKGHHDLS